MVSGIIVFQQCSCYMVTIKLCCGRKSWTVKINWPVIPTTLDRFLETFTHEVGICVRTHITHSVLSIDSRINSACTGKHWWRHDQTLTLCGASSGSWWWYSTSLVYWLGIGWLYYNTQNHSFIHPFFHKTSERNLKKKKIGKFQFTYIYRLIQSLF